MRRSWWETPTLTAVEKKASLTHREGERERREILTVRKKVTVERLPGFVAHLLVLHGECVERPLLVLPCHIVSCRAPHRRSVRLVEGKIQRRAQHVGACKDRARTNSSVPAERQTPVGVENMRDQSSYNSFSNLAAGCGTNSSMRIDASSTPVPVTKADTNRKVKVRHL